MQRDCGRARPLCFACDPSGDLPIPAAAERTLDLLRREGDAEVSLDIGKLDLKRTIGALHERTKAARLHPPMRELAGAQQHAGENGRWDAAPNGLPPVPPD